MLKYIVLKKYSYLEAAQQFALIKGYGPVQCAYGRVSGDAEGGDGMVGKNPARPETKYYSPRLLSALAGMSGYPLTLLEAPSGFGKTTALQHFLTRRISQKRSVLWYTFREASPRKAWRDLCAVLEAVDRETAGRLWDAGLPEEDALPRLERVLRGLRCPEETYLVLDNFHAWGLDDPGRFLMSLSCHGAKKLHIVVVTQPLPREQHKVIVESDRLRLLQEDIFAFNQEEIAAYYRKAGVDLPQARVEALFEITQGWIMALYLQLLSFIKTGDFETGGMEGLIRNALWSRLTREERMFFLKISVFPSFTFTQAAALSGMGKRVAEGLLREKRFFVRFDKTTRRFSFHELFRRFLKAQFALLPEAAQREIYLAGGELAERTGDLFPALHLYYLADAMEKIFSMPLNRYEIIDVIDAEAKSMVSDLLARASWALKLKYPAAVISLAFPLFFMGEAQKFAAMEEEINRIIVQSDLPREKKNALLGEMELLLSFREYNRIEAMSARHRRALDLLGGPATLIDIKSTWTFGAPSVLYLFYRESGRLEEELRQMEDCLPIYFALTGGHGTGAGSMMRAEAQFMRGAFDAAEALGYQAIYQAEQREQDSICECGLFLMARIAAARGDRLRLRESMEAFRIRAGKDKEDLCRYTWDLARGFLAVTAGRIRDVPDWLAQGELIARRLVPIVQPFAYIVHARLLLEQKKYGQLLGACGHFARIAGASPQLLAELYCKIYTARGLYAMGEEAKAVSVLDEALSAALPDGVYMPFAENYAGLAPLLPAAAAARDQSFAPLLELCRQVQTARASLYPPEIRLTPREQEVFDMVRRGRNNGEIAAELHISVNTAKNILKHIYKKTNVSTKTQLALLEIK